MKTLFIPAILAISTAPLIGQDEKPESDLDPELAPIEIHVLRLIQRSGEEASQHLENGDPKSALKSYREAVSFAEKEKDKFLEEYQLYKARYVSLALRLAADSIDADDDKSARRYLRLILADEIAPQNLIASDLLESIGAGPESEPVRTGSWTYTPTSALPSINREWGFLMIKGVEPGILVDGDIVEMVRDESVEAEFEVKIPERAKKTLILSVKGDSKLPSDIRNSDTFRLKVVED